MDEVYLLHGRIRLRTGCDLYMDERTAMIDRAAAS